MAAVKKKREDATSMAARQREIAVSEFFSKNRHLLGFDNPTKALLTTVREAVDNALDACEEADIMPEVVVQAEDLGNNRYRLTVTDNGPGILKNQLDKIFGQLLYGSKFHRLKQSRGQQGIGISAATMYGQMTTGQPAVVTSKTGKGRPANRMYLQIDTKKNRAKRIKEEICTEADWLERVSGTSIAITLEGNYKGGKHGIDSYLRQTSLANGHASITFIDPKGTRFEYPRVVAELPVEAKEIMPHPHGIELGTLMHMLQDARGQTVAAFLQSNFSRVTSQVSDEILRAAKVRPRMSATAAGQTEVEALYKAIQETKIMAPPTNCLSPIGEEALVKGLYWLFVEAQKERAAAKEEEEVEAAQAGKGHQDQLALGLDAPTAQTEGDGEPGAEAGGNTMERLKINEEGTIESEAEEFFVTAVTRPPAVYRGNPFQVEVGLFYGKGLPADQLARVYRFANRVPLQYQASACAMSRAVMSVPWRNYEVQQSRGAPPTGPLVIMVHIASGWVPYTSESKEAIAPYDEIAKELRLAIMDCGRRLQKFLRRRKRELDEEKKRSYITKYLDPIGEALQEILGFSNTEKDATLDELKLILEKSRPSSGKKKKPKKNAKKKAASEKKAAQEKKAAAA